eukprot:717710_1
MKCLGILMVFVTITTGWIEGHDIDLMDELKLNQLSDRHYSQQTDNLVDLDAQDDSSMNSRDLYENANDFDSDTDQNDYDTDDDDDAYQDEYYNEYYDDDDDEEDAYHDYDASYDDHDTYYDDDDYKNMNWMDQYFDEMDEFYYNSYRLHTSYDNFENMDFSQVLQHNTDAQHDDHDDDSYIHELLSSLHSNQRPHLDALDIIAQKHLFK